MGLVFILFYKGIKFLPSPQSHGVGITMPAWSAAWSINFAFVNADTSSEIKTIIQVFDILYIKLLFLRIYVVYISKMYKIFTTRHTCICSWMSAYTHSYPQKPINWAIEHYLINIPICARQLNIYHWTPPMLEFPFIFGSRCRGW